MTARASCRHCGKPIRWVRTSHGQRMPLDLAPDPRGNVVLIFGEAISVALPFDIDRPRFMPHAATCTGLEPDPGAAAPDPYQQIDMFAEGEP